MDKQPKKLAKTIAWGAVLFAVFVLPWFWMLWKQGGSKYLEVFLIDNHWKRFFANGSDHTEHFWFYYLLSFPVDFLPWTFFFLAFFWRFNKNSHRYWDDRSTRFGLIWFFVLLAFFSVSSSKRSIYLLPIFPAACLLSASWLDEHASPAVRRTALTLAAVMGLLMVGSSFTLVQKLDKDKTFVPLCEVVKANSQGKTLVGFDLSEMERGVFGFYLGGPFRNVRALDELSRVTAENSANNFLLIVNRNRMQDVAPVLEGKAKLIFEYRPDKKARSYLLYENSHR
jgi:4-amino-4-deoxy-L-arabinose transferase-like glycosyltransferase